MDIDVSNQHWRFSYYEVQYFANITTTTSISTITSTTATATLVSICVFHENLEN